MRFQHAVGVQGESASWLAALGPDDRWTLNNIETLAEVLLDEKILRDASAGLLRSLGTDPSQTATAAYQLANVLAAQGKKEEALEQLQFAATHTLPEEDFADAQTSAEFATLKVDTRFAAIQAAFRKRASASR